MYIAEAIKTAKELRPNEYSVGEILKWCDELSADIKTNYNPDFSKIIGTGNEIFLPEGVTIENITKIIADGRELKKENLNDFGIEYEYDENGRKLKFRSSKEIEYTIIYRSPYFPYRYIDETTNIRFGTVGTKKYFTCADIGIWVGDTLSVTIGESTYSLKIDAIERVSSEIRYFYLCSETITDGLKTGAKVYREIQDKTPVPPPYDTMYVDYIVMKAALFSGNQEIYNSFAAQVANKLNDYQLFLKRNMPREKKAFLNWI